MTPEQLVCLASARGATLDAITRGGEPEWTPEDLALGLAGLDRFRTWCALYSWAGDDSVRTSLKWRLMELLLAEREARGWATRVERVTGERSRFSEEMVELFLNDERRPSVLQKVPALRVIILRVEPEVWRRTLSHQYAHLGAVYAGALVDAEHHVRRKLRSRD